MTTQACTATVTLGHITVRGPLVSQNGDKATVLDGQGRPFTGPRIDMEYLAAA